MRRSSRGGDAPSSAASADVRPAGWWDLLPFTAHNIVLAPGLGTRPGPTSPSDDVRTATMVAARGGSMRGDRVVDLGSLEGGFTLAFAALGADAVGIEVRDVSVARAELARALLGETNATFICSDLVDELDRQPPADAVLATGILYHFADPLDVLRRIRQLNPAVLLVDTHVASDERTHECSDFVERVVDGHRFRGRLFHEFDADSTPSERGAMTWAAWSDEDAFWPIEDDLVRMLEIAGFAEIRKVDVADDAPWEVDRRNRVMYLATSGADHVEAEPERNGDLHRIEGDETTGSG
ncbi:MAG: methyltransferase domain-containing protein [Actinomycetota bacterium]